MPSAHPTGTDLKAFVVAENAGIDPTAAPYSGIDWDGMATLGRQNFENATGRTVLAVTGTKNFDPPTNSKGLLSLDHDLMTVTSVTLGGSTLVANTDYWLRPYDGGVDRAPYNLIQFAQPYPFALIGANRRSLVIVGTWGYATSVLQDAFDAELCLAAVALSNGLMMGRFSGAKEWREGDVNQKNETGSLREGWQARANMVINNYKRTESWGAR